MPRRLARRQRLRPPASAVHPVEEVPGGNVLPWQQASLRHAGGAMPRVTWEDQEAAMLPLPQRRTLQAHEVVFLVLASHKRMSFLDAIDHSYCGPHHEGISCSAYLDCELSQLRERAQNRIRSLKLVPASEYALADHLPRAQCCDRRQGGNGWDARGPVSLYCQEHSKVTLPAQYRFVPALAHARRTHLAELASGARKWLVLVDDDTWVSVPRLLELLGSVDDSRPVARHRQEWPSW